MNHRSRINQRVKTETAGKVDHRIIMNQPGRWLGLTPGLKGLLRKRLKEHGYVGEAHGYVGEGHGRRQVLEAAPPIGCPSWASARGSHGAWSEHALMVTGKESADSACPGWAGVDGGSFFADTRPIAYLSA